MNALATIGLFCLVFAVGAVSISLDHIAEALGYKDKEDVTP
jgi:hypothetical protein